MSYLTFERKPDGAPEGFGSKQMASENRVNPTPIVRELVQNALDAGHLAKRKPVRVEFSLEKIPSSRLPGFKEYTKAYRAACEFWNNNLGGAKAAVERIRNALGTIDEDEELDVLFVTDNGIGLDTKRMNSLLSDGASHKESERVRGSYGLGHFTVFPASNLQYILYAGVLKGGQRFFSSHAILASHTVKKKLYGKDGRCYMQVNNKCGDPYDRYVFHNNNGIPALMRDQLDDLKKREQSGSIVAVVAFNKFLNLKDWEESIIQVVAKHFFPAVHAGQLVVTVSGDDPKKKNLNSDNVGEWLDTVRDEKRASKAKESPLAGYRASEAYETLLDGYQSAVKKCPGVKVCFREFPEGDSGETRVLLFRSGMWITNEIPKNGPRQFGKFNPFNAVVLVEPYGMKKGGFFSLILDAEGDKHMEINENRLEKDKKQKLSLMLKCIQEHINSLAPESTGDSFYPDILPFDMLSDLGTSVRPRMKGDVDGAVIHQPILQEVPESIKAEVFDEHHHPEPSPSPSPSQDPGPVAPHPGPNNGNMVDFNPSASKARVYSAVVLNGTKVTIRIKADEDIENLGVRLLRDSGADPSCSRPVKDVYIRLDPSGNNAGEINDQTGRYAIDKAGDMPVEKEIGPMRKGGFHVTEISLAESLSSDAVVKLDFVKLPLRRHHE